MKKYAKILSILLCLSMLVGMIAMVATADTTEEKTVTLVASELGLENAADFTTATIDEITFTGDAGTNERNSPKYYANGTALRFYGANTFTVSAAEGYEIVSITITAGSDYIRESHSTLTNATAEGMGTNKVVLTPVDGTEDVVVTNPNTSGNFRVGTCSVTYKAVAAEDPSEPEVTEKFSYEIVSPTKIKTVFGFYEDRTGADENTFVDGNDGKCVTDGWYGRAGYSECTSANGLIALIMELDEVTTLGAIEIVGKSAANNAVDFDIQAWVDGAWVTVLSVDEDPFTSGLTVKFTFDKPVDTNKVRILVNKVSVETEQCYFMEVSLFEAKAGDVKNTLDLNGKVTADNAHASHPATGLVNGDKSDIVLFSNAEIDLTNNGEPTAIDGFALYYYRGGQAEAKNINVLVKLTADGEFEAIGQFATGFESKDPQDSLFVTFDQTYNAYAVMISTDVYGYVTEFELFQFEREVEPENPENPENPEDPTDPSEPENPENPEDPTEKQTATLVDGLNDGDKIVIFYNNGNTVIGDTLDSDGKRLNPVEATFDGEKLVIGEGMLVLTVDIDENDQITFITEDGKYLTSGETGNSVSLADAASAYSLWVLEEKDNGFFIKNVNASYSGKAQYLEYYKGFTTYGYTDGTSDVALYTYNFYLLGEADVEEPTDPTDPTDPETTEPEATEPEATEPEATEPEATEPEVTDPETTEPEATEPEATEPDQPGKTGNTTLSVLVGMLALSAIGGGILISKKKEF